MHTFISLMYRIHKIKEKKRNQNQMEKREKMVCIEMLNVIAYSLCARIRNSIFNPYTFINSFTFTELKSRSSEETHT